MKSDNRGVLTSDEDYHIQINLRSTCDRKAIELSIAPVCSGKRGRKLCDAPGIFVQYLWLQMKIETLSNDVDSTEIYASIEIRADKRLDMIDPTRLFSSEKSMKCSTFVALFGCRPESVGHAPR